MKNYMRLIHHLVICTLLIITAIGSVQAQISLPNALTSYAEMEHLLEQLRGLTNFSVSTITQTAGGNPVYLVKVENEEHGEKQFRILLAGQQHGNEPAGKEALLYLLRRIAETPELLPPHTALWILPMMNPDGAGANRRRNSNGADLNRDHIELSQPETQALHRLAQSFQPHVFVDCHEFTRDSRDYLDRGWGEWPLIMMDTANNPNFIDIIYETGVLFVEMLKPKMEQAGIQYTRYYVGGIPPEDELRFSTPDIDDARNGIGTYGGLSFIIESGIHRSTKNPQFNLDERVRAYNLIFDEILSNEEFRKMAITAVNKSRTATLPEYIGTNYFWGNHGNDRSTVKVIDQSSRKVIGIQTPNFMQDMITKRNVPRPDFYVIPLKFQNQYSVLLTSHGIDYKILETPQTIPVEPCSLLRVEKEFDPVYHRYGGRQIAERLPKIPKTFQPGAIIVNLEEPADRKAFLLLEPTMMYGLYQFQPFRETVNDDMIIPVYRGVTR